MGTTRAPDPRYPHQPPAFALQITLHHCWPVSPAICGIAPTRDTSTTSQWPRLLKHLINPELRSLGQRCKTAQFQDLHTVSRAPVASGLVKDVRSEGLHGQRIVVGCIHRAARRLPVAVFSHRSMWPV